MYETYAVLSIEAAKKYSGYTKYSWTQYSRILNLSSIGDSHSDSETQTL